MNVLVPDWMIESEIRIDNQPDGPAPPGWPSHGVTSYGYDARMANRYKVPDHERSSGVIDPLIPGSLVMREIQADHLIIPAHGFALVNTIEVFHMPRGWGATVLGKSTLARQGILLNTTPLEPEWVGQITIEISNVNNQSVRLTAGMAICQVQFHVGVAPPRVSYADRKGKYQNQVGVVEARA